MKLFLALLLKGAIGKWLITAGTMAVSIAVYSMNFGWPFATGLVVLIFVHELGHLIAARQSNLQVGAPVFIPFVGAWIALKDERMPPAVEAHVAIAGPMLGSIFAFAVYLYGVSGHGRIYMALAQAGFMINLFNLIPLSPLDGGRLAGVISPKLWYFGIPLMIGAFLYSPSPLLIVIVILALPRLLASIKGQTKVETLETNSEKFMYGGMYLSLAISLAIMAYEAHQSLNGGGF